MPRTWDVSVVVARRVAAEDNTEAIAAVCGPIRQAFGGGDSVGIGDVVAHVVDPEGLFDRVLLDRDRLLTLFGGDNDDVVKAIYALRQVRPDMDELGLMEMCRKMMSYLAMQAGPAALAQRMTEPRQ